MIATLWRYLSLALAVLAVAAVIAALSFRGSAIGARSARDGAIAERDAARAQATQLQAVIDTERAKAQRLAEIAADYEAQKREIETEAERTVADLRAGNLRLRSMWEGQAATAELSQAAARAAEPDGRADDRARSAARIIAAGASCDAQVRGLQAVVTADRARP